MEDYKAYEDLHDSVHKHRPDPVGETGTAGVIDILGAGYTITRKKYDEDKGFSEKNYAGYCCEHTKTIVVCDMETWPGEHIGGDGALVEFEKKILRHEIVHAFLNESGLSHDAFESNGSWAKNEEMVDWIAIQFPKMQKAFELAGCL